MNKLMGTIVAIVIGFVMCFLVLCVWALIKSNMKLRKHNKSLIDYAVHQDQVIEKCSKTVYRCKELTDKLRPEIYN